jgi:transposase
MMRAETNTEISIGDEPVVKRLHRSKQERRRIVEESLAPGASVAVVARSHGVNANQVFHWRKLYREGRLDLRPASRQLIPVRIAKAVNEERRPHDPCAGRIHIELGRARVRLEGCVDRDSLRLVLEHLGR